MIDWKARAIAAEARVAELETENTTLRGKLGKLGRPRKTAETEDQQLVERACKALGVSIADLAERLGMQRNSSAMLTRPKLPAARREQIEAMVEAAKAPAEKS